MSLKDLLYPKFCLGCGYLGTYICPSCRKKIDQVDKANCLYCYKESTNGLTHPECLQRLNVDQTVSIYKYNAFMRKVIKCIKYRLAREILDELLIDIKPDDLAKLLQMKRVLSGALIQPIPLTPRKLKSRGFNQAHLLAKFFSRVLGLEMADYLIRTKDPGAQAEAKSKSDRYRNIRGVFNLRPRARIKYRRVILVDDVITTGATVREAAGILKRHGVEKVYVLSLCR